MSEAKARELLQELVHLWDGDYVPRRYDEIFDEARTYLAAVPASLAEPREDFIDTMMAEVEQQSRGRTASGDALIVQLGVLRHALSLTYDAAPAAVPAAEPVAQPAPQAADYFGTPPHGGEPVAQQPPPCGNCAHPAGCRCHVIEEGPPGLCKKHNWYDPIYESPCPRCAAQQPEAPTLAEGLSRAVQELVEYARGKHPASDTNATAVEVQELAACIESDAERIRELEAEWKRECDDADGLLRALGLNPDEFRTDGGSLNVARIVAASHERERAAYERAAKVALDWPTAIEPSLCTDDVKATAFSIAAGIRALATPDSAASPTGGEG